MAFGIYIHIPYCLQICPYCDFAKYEHDKILPPAQYVANLQNEIMWRAHDLNLQPDQRKITSVYFGGGTPSLLDPKDILTILRTLANTGFQYAHNCEVTLEINPGTLLQDRLERFLEAGVNRFSVGAQTFSPRLLALAGRKHSVQETLADLARLDERGLNYSFDLLFALPTQTLQDVCEDLTLLRQFRPSHLSAYCLTVPESHSMAKNRASDDVQGEMFDHIEVALAEQGLARYEISNYARPGRESQHNLLYWTDQEYWGLGVSSHSYLHRGDWGTRFWNSPHLPKYLQWVETRGPWPKEQEEVLQRHEGLTDYLHTSLRLLRGLDTNAARLKCGDMLWGLVLPRLQRLEERQLLQQNGAHWVTTRAGRLLFNQVLADLTFLPDELLAH